MEPKLLRAVSLPLFAAVVVWWVGNAIASAASKKIMLWAGDDSTLHDYVDMPVWTAAFTDLRWVDLTLLQHMAGLLLAILWLKATRRPILPDNAKGTISVICIAGVGNVVGNLATNAAYALLNSSIAHMVKTCEPLVTMLLSLALNQHHTAVNISTLLSVVMSVIAAMTFMKGDSTYNMWGLVAGIISSIAFPIRNVSLYSLSIVWENPVQKFAVMSLFSAVFMLPVSAVKLVLKLSLPKFPPADGLISSVFHTTYNMASVIVLENLSPVPHALLNLLKRAVMFTANVMYYQVPVSWTLVIGLVVISVGCYLYYISYTSKNKYLPLKCVIVFAYFVYLVMSYSTALLSSHGATHCTPQGTRISTSWVFDRDIPDSVLTNLAELARTNPHSDLHVYCGTTQCMQALSKSDKDGVLQVEFINVMEVVKDTPLQQWMVRHPFNKVVSGREFENHLQDVVKLGLLLKYGGIYADARAGINKELACLLPMPWMTAPTKHSQGLDVAHFPKNHSFINKLARRYVTRYFIRSTERRPLQFHFQQEISILMRDRMCVDCPNVVDNLLGLGLASGDGHVTSARHYGTFMYNVRVLIATEVNLGDEVQDFPGLQYLPYVDTFLERDRLNVSVSPSSPKRVTTFFNAWWGAEDAYWPPASNIEPVMVSVHIGEDMFPQWVQHVNYLRDKQPIGCRDHSTLDFLNGLGINAYFSGCMTLLMANPNVAAQRNDIIYLVDLTDDIKFLLPFDIQTRAVSVSHAYWGMDRLDNVARFTEAYDRIVHYGSAKLVVTQRIHCALPCVAMGTPVIFVDFPGLFGATDTKSSPRTAGLTPMFHTLDLYTTSREKAMEWLQDFPWDNPPPNPNFGLVMQLRTTLWSALRHNQVFYDSARRFGLLPLTQLPSWNVSNLTFHVVVPMSTDQQLSNQHSLEVPRANSHLNWRVWRCIESILYHHPLAEVKVYSTSVKQEEMNVVTEAGYQVKVHNYSVRELLASSPAYLLPAKAISADKSGDMLGLLLLYHYGGVYVNTDTVLVRPLHTLPMNSVGYQDKDNHTLSSVVMMFEKGHSYVQACLQDLGQHAYSLVSQLPLLLIRVWASGGHTVHVLPYHVFNMFEHKLVTQQCLRDTAGPTFDANMELLSQHAYGVSVGHLHTSYYEVGSNKRLKPRTICSKLFNSYCILCNNVY